MRRRYCLSVPSSVRRCPSTPTSTSTPSTPGRRAGTRTSSTWRFWARRKGITVVGTGDFTHPAWFEEIRSQARPRRAGALPPAAGDRARGRAAACRPSCHGPVRFLLEVEISTIYKKGDRTRKVHHLIYASNLDTAGRFRGAARRRSATSPRTGGRSSGSTRATCWRSPSTSGPDAYLIPAHVWTPWFAALGSKSGFDSIDECYGDLAPHIFAVETGPLLRPADELARLAARPLHPGQQLGRPLAADARAARPAPFATDLDYFAIRRALETGEGYGGTVEFFPEEGKYHLDGHRACGVRLEPPETRRLEGRCPACGKPLTVGVMHRVEELADRAEEAAPAARRRRSAAWCPCRRCWPRSTAWAPSPETVEARRRASRGPAGPGDRYPGAPPAGGRGARRRRRSSARRSPGCGPGNVRRDAGYDGEYGVIRLFDAGRDPRAVGGGAAVRGRLDPWLRLPSRRTFRRRPHRPDRKRCRLRNRLPPLRP